MYWFSHSRLAFPGHTFRPSSKLFQLGGPKISVGPPIIWRLFAGWVFCAQGVLGAQTLSNCSDSVLGPKLALVNDEVQRAIDSAHWGKSYNLRAYRNPVVVVTPKAVLLYGRSPSEKLNPPDVSSVFFNSFSEAQPEGGPRCFSQPSDERMPTAVVFGEPSQLGLQAPDKAKRYHFVYENSELSLDKPRNLIWLGQALGPFLVVNLRDFSLQETLEVGRTVVHEGAHLFGQKAVMAEQPPSSMLTRSSRGEVEERILESEYARLVIREGRYAAWLLRRILVEKTRAESNLPITACDKSTLPVDRGMSKGVPFSKLQLQRHFDFLYSCVARRNGGNSQGGETESRIGRNELFWYFVEGVPQYLEQQYALRSERTAISKDEALFEVLKQFEPYCTSSNGHDIVRANSAFQPLILGSAYVHILERIHGSRAALEERFGFDTQGLANWFDIGSSYQRLVSIGEPNTINELSTCQ